MQQYVVILVIVMGCIGLVLSACQYNDVISCATDVLNSDNVQAVNKNDPDLTQEEKCRIVKAITDDLGPCFSGVDPAECDASQRSSIQSMQQSLDSYEQSYQDKCSDAEGFHMNASMLVVVIVGYLYIRL